MKTTTVSAFTSPKDGELVVVEAAGTAVTVTCLDGELFAFEDTCPHAGCSLAGGDLEERTIRCPCHFARFDVTTGAVLDGPAATGVRTWAAALSGDELQLDGPRSTGEAEASSPAAPAGTSSAEPVPDADQELDLGVLVEREHDAFRRQFGSLEVLTGRDALEKAWATLTDLLEIHASAEERILYPHLVRAAEQVTEEAEQAVHDHNDIRDSLRAVPQDVGSEAWWHAVRAAQEVNEQHLQEEERDVLPAFRDSVARQRRQELGREWLAFHADHDGARGLSGEDADPAEVVEQRP